jgi:DNA processing protein
MEWTIRKIFKKEYPEQLLQLSRLPDEMDIVGSMPSYDNKFLCVVGSREHTSYGAEVCASLIKGLQGYPIVIVSGLAIGMDSLAHESALEAGLKTLAFPGSGLSLSILYPATRRRLAARIVESGGAVVSPFELEQAGTFWTFPNRNRLMAGISHATLILEAENESGTLITAKAALEFGRELLVVPGSIFSEYSFGSHKLLKDGAASPARNSADILQALGFIEDADEDTEKIAVGRNIEELELSQEQKNIYRALLKGGLSSSDLIDAIHIPISSLNIALSELELKGLIKERGNLYEVCR